MKKKVLILISVGMIIFATLFSCENGNTPSGANLLYNIIIDETEYAASATYNFGLTQAGSSGISKAITLTNTGDSDITVNTVVLSDLDNYSITTPALPFTAAAGGTADVGLSFSPQESGSLPATVSITIAGITDPFVLNLTGSGNFAPTVKYGISVAGSGNEDTNGFYNRDGSLTVGDYRRPNYTKTTGVNYHCSLSEDSNNMYWGIDQTTTSRAAAPPPSSEYYIVASDPTFMIPPAEGWYDSNDNQVPSFEITHYDITGDYCYVGEELTANYFYSDIDGDLENTSVTTFQWYRSDTEDGTYTEISGATLNTYTPISDYVSKYLKVEITPASSTGILTGAATLSSPTIQVIPAS